MQAPSWSGVLRSALIAVVVAAVSAVVTGAIVTKLDASAYGATQKAQAKTLDDQAQAIGKLDEKKADRQHVDEIIGVWTASNKREIDSLKADNTKAHDDISSKLNQLIKIQNTNR
jgi:parvulin-like peptidyl-prolyl isomerase